MGLVRNPCARSATDVFVLIHFAQRSLNQSDERTLRAPNLLLFLELERFCEVKKSHVISGSLLLAAACVLCNTD